MKNTVDKLVLTVALIAVLAALAFDVFGSNPSRDYYGVTAEVLATDGHTTQVTNGWSVWEFTGTFGCEPFSVGDEVVMVMKDNGGLMDDDEVINVCYNIHRVVAAEK